MKYILCFFIFLQIINLILNMRLKFQTLIVIILSAHFALAQVTKVDIVIKYNKKDKLSDVYMIVLEGQSKTNIDRILFNSQVSFKVPAGTYFEVVKSYNPIQNNQNKNETIPAEWTAGKPTKSPKAAPKFDFYPVTNQVMPTAFFNDLKPGDEVKLFTIDNKSKKGKKMKLYERRRDPDETANGMQNRDFSTSFCVGGVDQDYIKF
jgi:hypothetical protein